MPTEPNPPKVFISYSHDSQEHIARVVKLSDTLCYWGIDCHIDQYELAPANWLKWMERQIKDADFVLVVCTETYCRRFDGRETRPTGVGWEGGVITTQLYEQQQDKSAKFIPVVFSQEDEEHIPTLLRATHRHKINIEKINHKDRTADHSGLMLYRHLAKMPSVIKPKLGQLVVLPPINRREDIDEEEKEPVGSSLPQVVRPSETKIEAKAKAEDTVATPPEKPNSTQSNTAKPTSVTLKMKNARVAYTVSPSTGSGQIEGLPVEFYRVASGGQKTHSNFTEDLGNGIKLEMIAIPGGSFLMGSEDFDNTKPVHPVKLSPFHIGKFQVTQAQWQAVMRKNPSHFKGDKLPVESVTWNEAVSFCEKLSKQTGKVYRLPTEAEWEYACRAGSTGKYCFGDDITLLKRYAWYNKNSGNKTHPVGEKLPNDWGLYDMHGNVREWCLDRYDADYYAELSKQGEAINPQGPTNGDYRVLRGGSWVYGRMNALTVSRLVVRATGRFKNSGFRVVAGRPPSSS